MENTTPGSGILTPLPKSKKTAVTAGCILLMLSITMFGVGFFVIQGPILAEMNASEAYSLLTLLASLGLSVMTPIGGRLGDLFGRRKLVLISGLLCILCSIGMSFIRSILPFFILRFLLGAAQGASMSIPYILLREINEPKEVPRAMGFLASAIAIGGFGGSILLGAMADAGYLSAAILLPSLPLLPGILLIAAGAPNKKGRTKGPIIPVYLFKNRSYVLLLVIGFISCFYQTAMNAYAPVAVQQILRASAAASGSLQLPRTIVTMLFPALFGSWIGKDRKNLWFAMAMATGLITLAYIPLCFTTPQMPIYVYILALGVTGIAESFRSVSVTPAAQATLKPQDLGVGTSLITFINSLSGLSAAAVYGAIYRMYPGSLQTAINRIHLFTAVISAVGLLTVIYSARSSS